MVDDFLGSFNKVFDYKDRKSQIKDPMYKRKYFRHPKIYQNI